MTQYCTSYADTNPRMRPSPSAVTASDSPILGPLHEAWTAAAWMKFTPSAHQVQQLAWRPGGHGKEGLFRPQRDGCDLSLLRARLEPLF